MSSLALLGGSPVRRKPFATWPVFDEAERTAILEVLESGNWGGYNPKVAEFEKAFADYHQTRFAISASNGTVTLEAALRAAGIGPGDEVLVPSITFIATATAVLRVGAMPVFADIEPATGNLDPARLKEAITPATRAVVPVHFAGHPADMDAILEIAREHSLIVIEDAAHAHGASWTGRMVGSFGHFGSFSFQQSKNMTAGEGGILTTNDDDLAAKVRAIANQGRRAGGDWYEHVSLGTNLRLTGWQAAILLCQLARLPAQIEKRAQNARLLADILRDTGAVLTPAVDPRVTAHGFYLYLLRIDESALPGVSQELFVRALAAEGIPGASSYPYPIYRNAVFASYPHRILDCSQAEKFCRECFWLSHEVLLAEEEDLNDVAKAIVKVRDAAGALTSMA